MLNLELSVSPSDIAAGRMQLQDKVVLGHKITKERHLGCRHLGFAKSN